MDKELVVFPLLSRVATVLVMVSSFVPMLVRGGRPALAELERTYLGYAVAFLFCLVLYTVAFFFNAALVGAALIRLDGGDPTISGGLPPAPRQAAARRRFEFSASGSTRPHRNAPMGPSLFLRVEAPGGKAAAAPLWGRTSL